MIDEVSKRAFRRKPKWFGVLRGRDRNESKKNQLGWRLNKLSGRENGFYLCQTRVASKPLNKFMNECKINFFDLRCRCQKITFCCFVDFIFTVHQYLVIYYQFARLEVGTEGRYRE